LGTGSRVFGEAQGASRERWSERRKQPNCRGSLYQALFRDHIAAGRSLHGKEGSAVRVRQRALQKRRKSALFRLRGFARSPVCGACGALYGAFRFQAPAPKRRKWAHSPEREYTPSSGRAAATPSRSTRSMARAEIRKLHDQSASMGDGFVARSSPADVPQRAGMSLERGHRTSAARMERAHSSGE
jgi:hypothetical protein